MSDAPQQQPEPLAPRDLGALLAATSAADRAVWGIALVLLVLAFALGPVLVGLDPRVTVSRAFHYGPLTLSPAGYRLDPWGREYASAEAPAAPYELHPYSLGPDGRDDHGRGDDVRVLPEDHPLLRLASQQTSYVLMALGVLLGGGWELLRLLRRQLGTPWAGPGPEALRAGAIGLPAGLIGGALGVLVPRMVPALQDPVETAEKSLVVPFPVAAGGGAWIVVTLFVLWLRARPPAEPPPSPAAPG